MQNLKPKDAVKFTEEEIRNIDILFKNNPEKSGTDLWKEDGPNQEYVKIKKHIREHYLELQHVRCVFCERVLVYGDVQIEHFAPKGRHRRFLYEPLNLTCSCTVCNNFSNKGAKDTINGNEEPLYRDNSFKYVHPFLHDVDEHIKYRGLFNLFIDYERSSDIGKATIKMFHWDTTSATKRRFANLLYWSTDKQRRKMISEILNYED